MSVRKSSLHIPNDAGFAHRYFRPTLLPFAPWLLNGILRTRDGFYNVPMFYLEFEATTVTVTFSDVSIMESLATARSTYVPG